MSQVVETELTAKHEVVINFEANLDCVFFPETIHFFLALCGSRKDDFWSPIDAWRLAAPAAYSCL